ncbi:hypothetical protein ACLMJK_001328 [Lecanora helva]
MILTMRTYYILSLFLGTVLAAPAPQNVFPAPYCEIQYTKDSEDHVEGDLKTGDYTVAGGSGLTTGSSFSTSVTVTVGADISVSDIAGLGLSASVAKTTTKTTSQGASVPCPQGPWKCALAIYPEELKVSGQKEAANRYCSEEEKDGKLPDPYTVFYPVENDSGGIKSRVEVCACKNYDHWDDKGAPSIKCDTCPL